MRAECRRWRTRDLRHPATPVQTQAACNATDEALAATRPRGHHRPAPPPAAPARTGVVAPSLGDRPLGIGRVLRAASDRPRALGVVRAARPGCLGRPGPRGCARGYVRGWLWRPEGCTGPSTLQRWSPSPMRAERPERCRARDQALDHWYGPSARAVPPIRPGRWRTSWRITPGPPSRKGDVMRLLSTALVGAAVVVGMLAIPAHAVHATAAPSTSAAAPADPFPPATIPQIKLPEIKLPDIPGVELPELPVSSR